MKLQATINTFSEGLALDYNPLTTPNNVLTSCLNGTFLTYNGNEFVLQTDMGNGRVETAYLPSGYVPLGVKESGGIIYIASYNPITNKGQIGSFPSPERNISSEELKSLDTNIQLSKFNASNLVLRIKLIGGDTIIRPGDKFSILMSGNHNDLSKFISNYDVLYRNEQEKINIVCPKNKLITLDVAVLDSNNNLISISKQLKRFNLENNNIIDTSNLNSKETFNIGYFTQDYNKNELDLNEFRTYNGSNTFNNKISGELFIIATLNTVLYFSCGIGGSKDATSTIINFSPEFKYNCPDGLYNNTETYGNFLNFDPKNTIKGYKIEYEIENNEKTIRGLSKEFSFVNYNALGFTFGKIPEGRNPYTLYLKNEDLYLTKQYDSLILDNITSGLLKYTITPLGEFNGSLNLTNLSIKGTLNISKLGTGEVNLVTWRYWKNPTNLVLLWGLEDYSTEEDKISQVLFDFYDFANLGKNPYTIKISLSDYNGVYTEVLNLPIASQNLNSKIIPGRLYLVKITILKKNPKVFYRWVFNTTLYNDLYLDNTIQDFGIDTLKLKDSRVLELISQGDITLLPQGYTYMEGDTTIYSYKYLCDYSKIVNIEKLNLIPYNFEHIIINNSKDLLHVELLDKNAEISYVNDKFMNDMINSSNFIENPTISKNIITVNLKSKIKYDIEEVEKIAENVITPILKKSDLDTSTYTSFAVTATGKYGTYNPTYIGTTNLIYNINTIHDGLKTAYLTNKTFTKFELKLLNDSFKDYSVFFQFFRFNGQNPENLISKQYPNRILVPLFLSDSNNWKFKKDAWNIEAEGEGLTRVCSYLYYYPNRGASTVTEGKPSFKVWWKSYSNNNHILLDISDDSKSFTNFFKLCNFYKYNLKYINLTYKAQGLNQTKYNYNNTYNANFSLQVSIDSAQEQIIFDTYNSQITTFVQTVLENNLPNNDLTDLVKFTQSEKLIKGISNKFNYNILVNGMSEYYTKLSDVRVNYKIFDYLPDGNLTPNNSNILGVLNSLDLYKLKTSLFFQKYFEKINSASNYFISKDDGNFYIGSVNLTSTSLPVIETSAESTGAGRYTHVTWTPYLNMVPISKIL